VTRKDDHRIVDTGPYGLVRHPIYTGILLALYATTLAFPGPFNVAGSVLMTIAFVIKARLEERFLSEELGAEAYAAYRRRVPMLVPFWPVSRG
jgi:protein-S-isoprenylcysteine O-methyltransferase Ste14